MKHDWKGVLTSSLALAVLSLPMAGGLFATGATALAAPAEEITGATAPSLMAAFDQAADEFGVPVELLLGLSYTTTAWTNARGYDAHSAREFGVMGLRAHSLGPSLEEASALLGISEARVRDDQRENIRGGAALLALYAYEANGGEPPAQSLNDLEALTVWWNAVGRYSGVADIRHQDMFAVQLFETLDQGAEGRYGETGEMIRLPAVPLPSVLGDWIADARAQYRRQIDATAQTVDYAGASWVAACSSNYSNYSRTASDISYVIIHKVEGSYSGCISWFQNCSAQVSAHYVVSYGGDVTQMVLEEDVAWHAGNWDYNYASVGIEHEGYTYGDDNTDALYKGSAALTRDICERNNIPKNRSQIIGHSEVPGATHTDPGPYWDWDYYMQLVGGSGGGGGGGEDGTGNLVGMVKEGDIYDGAPIVGAVITLNTGAQTTTSSSGYYSFAELPVATYTVTAAADCYRTNSTSKTIQAGVDNWASIALQLSESCGGDPPSCRVTIPEGLADGRNHAASHSPLDRLPWSSAGFFLGVGGLFIALRRRR